MTQNQLESLRLTDVLFRGTQSQLADDWLPSPRQEQIAVTLDEGLLGWSAFGAQPAGTADDASPLAVGDLILAFVQMSIIGTAATTAADAELAEADQIFSIRVQAAAVYEVRVAMDEAAADKLLQPRVRRDARALLRNRLLEEAASLRLPTLPFAVGVWPDLDD